MENLRENDTIKREDLLPKRKRSPSPDTKSGKIKSQGGFFQIPKVNSKPIPIPKAESSPETSENSDNDYSQYENIQDTFNQNKPCYTRLNPPLPSLQESTKLLIQNAEIIKHAPVHIQPPPPPSLSSLSIAHSPPSYSMNIDPVKIESSAPANKVTTSTNIANIPTSSSYFTKLPRENTAFFEKYAPISIKEIIGNRSQSLKLHSWLGNWSTSAKCKAVLLSGPPGTGKTTAARVASKTCKLTTIEFNASDCRNKQVILEKIRPFVCNTSMVGPRKTGKSVLIMDEVDGMSTGDEGGIAALIECIKITRIPIICICNDRYSSNIKSLVKYCLDIKFNKPIPADVYALMKTIAETEKIPMINDKVSTSMVESANGDLRALMNMLEMSKRNSVFSFTKDKTVSLSPSEAAALIMDSSKAKKYSLSEKVSLAFIDTDLISGLIFENYTEVCNGSDLSEAADALALSDIVNTRIRKEQNWSLLPDFVHLSLLAASFSETSGCWPAFPQMISKNSTLTKNSRLLNEFKHAIWHISNGCDDLSADQYRHLLMEKIVYDSDVEEKKSLVQMYRIDKNIVKENIVPFVGKGLAAEFAKISKKSKKWLSEGFGKSTGGKKKVEGKGTEQVKEDEDEESEGSAKEER